MKLPTGGWVPIVIKQGNIFEPVTLSHNVPFHVSWHSVGGCYHNFSLIFFYLVRDKRNPEHLIDSKNQRSSLFYCSYFFPWFFFFFFFWWIHNLQNLWHHHRCHRLWTGVVGGLLIPMLKKLTLFHLKGLIT